MGGARYDELLHKEERYRTCRKNMFLGIDEYFGQKAKEWNTCASDKDCVFEAYGHGFSMNRTISHKLHGCFMYIDNWGSICDRILDKEQFACIRDKDYPCYQGEPLKIPTHFTCERHTCVAHYDGPANAKIVAKFIPSEGWHAEKKCTKELDQLHDQLQKKYVLPGVSK